MYHLEEIGADVRRENLAVNVNLSKELEFPGDPPESDFGIGTLRKVGPEGSPIGNDYKIGIWGRWRRPFPGM